MSADEKNATAAKAPRRKRGVLEQLLTIVHWLEVLALVFAAMAMWGVSRDWPQPLTVFGVMMVLVVVTRLLRFSWGWAASLVSQALVLSLGFMDFMLIVVGLIFFAMWVFCFIKGRQIERQQRAG